MMSETEKNVIKMLFENAKNGKYPDFGSPEMKCDKCMFYQVVCSPIPEHVGCFCGWKRELG